MLHAEKCAKDVGVKGGGVTLGGLLRYRPGAALRARVIDGGIQAAKALDSLINETAHIVLMAHVGADEFGFGTQLTEFGCQLLTLLFAPAGNDEASPFLRESDGGGPANAGQGTSDEDDGISLRRSFHGISDWRFKVVI